MNPDGFTYDGRYHFDFLPSGFFTLLNHKGESYYPVALMLFEKLCNHLIWMILWTFLVLVSHYFFSSTYLSDRIFMSLIILHLFFFGCRLTTLLLRGGIKPLLFPPLWVRLTKKMQKGKGLELLKEYELQNHPGLLTNLALAQYSRKEDLQAKTTLQRALSHCPDHPALIELSSYLSSIKSF